MPRLTSSITASAGIVAITGGGTGIGRAVALAIADEGGKVMVTGRRLEPLKAVSESSSGGIRFVQADVSQPQDVVKAVSSTVEQFGRLDVLVNNAGASCMGPLAELSNEDIELLLGTNLRGTLVAIREALPHLTRTRGAIVNVTSVTARAATPGMAAYGGTKAAIEHVTRSLAVEVGPAGVRANVVAPGFTMTEMAEEFMDDAMMKDVANRTPLRRAGTAEDVARSILFLASDDAAWVTGQVLQSSGGLAL